MTVSKLQRWLSGQPRRVRTLRQRTSKLRPRLELMEDRVVPATFVVSSLADDGANTLRAAITSANAAPGVDTIDASALNGTISLLSALPTITDDTNIIGSGASTLTVTRDPGAATNFRIFFVDNGAKLITVNFTGLTISGGNADRGSGIRIPYERTTITACVITGNSATAGPGGGIDSRADTDMTIIDSTISGNSATGNGGGFYAGYNGHFLMTGSTVSGNTSGGTGGGLYFFAYTLTTTWVIKNSTISSNLATADGGGIGLIGKDQHTTIQNSTITNNTAGGTGGGISTVYSSAPVAGDVTVLESSIVSGNSGSNADIATPGTLAAQKSAIGDNTGFTLTDNGGNLIGQNLLLGPLANNGGPTESHLPGAGSPVINAGFNAIFQGVDQRGFQRTAGSQVDIGAIETGASQPAGNIPGVGVVTAFGATSYQIQVTYTDATLVNVSTIDVNDITVAGPSGAATVTNATVSGGNAASVVATYTITPPGGTFDLADNGFFTVSSVMGQVTDTSGNGITTGILGRFQVALIAVTNTNDSGAGSLRQAILDSNASVGLLNTIGFAIGTGAVTISPTSPLPAMSDSVVLDATSQPGYAGIPLVQLAGNLAGAGAIGLEVAASNSVVRGFVVNRFGTGVQVDSVATNAIVQGNYIGTDAAGAAASGNGVGIFVAGTNGALIGSDLNGTNDAAERNVVSGNTAAGVRGGGAGSPLTVAQFTSGVGANNHYYVLTSPATWGDAEVAAVAAGGHLVSITSAEEQDFVAASFLPTLGGTSAWMGLYDPAGGNAFQWVTGEPLVYTNWGATQPDGSGSHATFNYPNNGTWDDDGSTGAKPTIMEFNTAPNVVALATTLGVVANRFQGNYIGTNAAGAAAVPNGAGVDLGGAFGTTVRGNVISGNTGDGVRANTTPNLATYQWSTGTGANNHFYLLTPPALWTDAEAAAVAAGGHLVSITSADEQAFVKATFLSSLGGASAWMGLYDPAGGNAFQWVTGEPLVYTNWAVNQPDNSGSHATFNFPNDGAGTWDDDGSTGGKPTIMEFNTAPNLAAFSGLFNGGGSYTITGNLIGSNAAGTAALANGGAGVSVDNLTGITIGGAGAGAGNTIRNNTGAGVAITGANANVSVRGNSIFSNGGLGIDLGATGVTLNDVGDPDAGPNGLQNFPVLTAAASGATTTVSGTFNGLASTTFTLDFYASATADPSTYGEGQRYLGSTPVTTNASGNATFTNAVIAGASAGGEIISATATDPAGNTSEFAINVTATGGTAPTVTATSVNGGAAQRSRVTTLDVTFSAQVTFAGPVASAFTLTRTGGGAVNFTATANVVGGVTVVTLNGFTGTETTSGSLNDGHYTLTALANQISAGGVNMAANYTFGDAQGLFRYYGDMTGDRRVDIADFGQFSLAYLTPANYNPALDYNFDGRIDIADFSQFSIRYFTTLP